MSDERILEVIERNDKYYILGFIKGIKASNELLQQEKNQLENNWKELKKYIENVENVNMILGYKVFYQNELILKMQEIESGNNE